MTREEAINKLKHLCSPEQMTALKVLVPELQESEDERIRKALIEGVRQIRCKNGITQEQMIAYLEKQKESSQDDIAAAYQLERADERKAKEQKPMDIRTWQKIVDKVLTDYNGIGQYLDNGICKQISEELREKYCFDDTSSDWENVYKKGIERGKNYGKAQAMKEQKSEWSEEDEKMFWGFTAYIPNEELERLGVTRDDILKKLKSLRPQPHWKPNKEQMEALDAAEYALRLRGSYETADEINSLSEDLKKL